MKHLHTFGHLSRRDIIRSNVSLNNKPENKFNNTPKNCIPLTIQPLSTLGSIY